MLYVIVDIVFAVADFILCKTFLLICFLSIVIIFLLISRSFFKRLERLLKLRNHPGQNIIMKKVYILPSVDKSGSRILRPDEIRSEEEHAKLVDEVPDFKPNFEFLIDAKKFVNDVLEKLEAGVNAIP